jgi:putative SOS response-associated peptidase YedK
MTAEQQELISKFPYLNEEDYFDIHGHKTSSEIFPGTDILAINNRHRAEDLWWTIEDRTWEGKAVKTINARCETVDRVPMFSRAFLEDRVLIPATGFYEWDAARRKHLFTFDEPIVAFAGLARECEIKGEPKRCGVILTTEANDIVRPFHPKGRMPVVLHQADYEKWLDPKTPLHVLRQLMVPIGNDEIHAEPADEPVPSLFDNIPE